jgi:3-hydroxyisobutyrate dehydrogenase-like beta-hydroxyacid dehydrogenase
MLASMLETIGEVFAVLRKSDVDPKLFLEIVNGNLFRSPVYENYGKAAAEGNFEPAGFKLRLGLKDVKLAMAAAEEVSAAGEFIAGSFSERGRAWIRRHRLGWYR